MLIDSGNKKENELHSDALSEFLIDSQLSNSQSPIKDKLGFSDILNFLDEIIIVIDKEFNIVLANHAARKISNNDVASCIQGKKCYEVLYQRTSLCNFCPLDKATSKGAGDSFSTFENREDNNLWSLEYEHHHQGKIFSSRWMFVDNKENNFPVIEIIRDITEIKKELQKKNHNIKLSLIGQMVSSIIHNLNNPLTGMALTISLMKRDLNVLLANTRTDSISKDYSENKIKSIFKSIKMLESDLRITNEIMIDLMNYSRPSPLIKQNKNIWLSMLKAIRNIKTHYPDLLKHSKIILIGKRRIINVPHAPERIYRVFINLINNSLQAVKGMKDGFVKIYILETSHSVKIVISDNGLGIPDNIQSRIFEPFFTTRKLAQGGGLGLSLSDDIMREHGGYIRVKSRPGHTVFFVIFPCSI